MINRIHKGKVFCTERAPLINCPFYSGIPNFRFWPRTISIGTFNYIVYFYSFLDTVCIMWHYIILIAKESKSRVHLHHDVSEFVVSTGTEFSWQSVAQQLEYSTPPRCCKKPLSWIMGGGVAPTSVNLHDTMSCQSCYCDIVTKPSGTQEGTPSAGEV